MYKIGIKIPSGLEDLRQRGRMTATAKVLSERNLERKDQEDTEAEGMRSLVAEH